MQTRKGPSVPALEPSTPKEAEQGRTHTSARGRATTRQPLPAARPASTPAMARAPSSPWPRQALPHTPRRTLPPRRAAAPPRRHATQAKHRVLAAQPRCPPAAATGLHAAARGVHGAQGTLCTLQGRQAPPWQIHGRPRPPPRPAARSLTRRNKRPVPASGRAAESAVQLFTATGHKVVFLGRRRLSIFESSCRS